MLEVTLGLFGDETAGLIERAEKLQDEEKWQEASQAWEQAGEACKRNQRIEDEDFGFVRSLNGRGQCLFQLGQVTDSLKAFQTADRLLREHHSRPDVNEDGIGEKPGARLLSIAERYEGTIALGAQMHEMALAFLRSAKSGLEKGDNPTAVADCELLIGEAARQLWSDKIEEQLLQESLRSYESARKVYSEAGDVWGLSWTSFGLSRLWHSAGETACASCGAHKPPIGLKQHPRTHG